MYKNYTHYSYLKICREKLNFKITYFPNLANFLWIKNAFLKLKHLVDCYYHFMRHSK